MRYAQSFRGRFHVRGSHPSRMLSVVKWAEDVASRMERATGQAMPFSDARNFHIVIRPGETLPSGRVRRSQQLKAGLLIQVLLVEGFERVDWEEVLEVFSSLLVDGYVAMWQQQEYGWRGGRAESAPAWLSVGLAQYIDRSLHTRNRRIVVRWTREGGVPSFAEILKWHFLSRGPSRQKVACSVAVAWLLARPDFSRDFEAVFDRLAQGKPLSPEWMATRLLRVGSVDEMEIAWRRWVGKQRLIVSNFGELSSDVLDRLSSELAARVGEHGVPVQAGLPVKMGFGDLAARKREKWIAAFTRAKTVELMTLAGGKPEELGLVVKEYCVFLKALRRRRWDRTLRILLARADASLVRLRQKVQKREKYVDEMAKKVGGHRRLVIGTEYDTLERSKLRRYVDSVERRIASAATSSVSRIETEANGQE